MGGWARGWAMAKLFEEVLNGASPTADIAICFSCQNESGAVAHGPSGTSVGAKPRAGSADSAAKTECGTSPLIGSPRPGPRRAAVRTASPKSSHLLSQSPAQRVSGSPLETGNAKDGPTGPPSSLRCHSLLLRTQPVLWQTLLQNSRVSRPSPGCLPALAAAAAAAAAATAADVGTSRGDASSAGGASLEECQDGTGSFGSECSPPAGLHGLDVAAAVEQLGEKLIEVTVDDEPEVFLEMLKFVYLNTCLVDHANVKALVLVANKYGIEDIVRHCLQWMQEHFTADLFYHFLSFRLPNERFQQLVRQSLLTSLRSRHHFTMVHEDKQNRWEQLPMDFVEALLNSDYLPVVSENEVLHLIARWVHGRLTREDADLDDAGERPSHHGSPRSSGAPKRKAVSEADGKAGTLAPTSAAGSPTSSSVGGSIGLSAVGAPAAASDGQPREPAPTTDAEGSAPTSDCSGGEGSGASGGSDRGGTFRTRSESSAAETKTQHTACSDVNNVAMQRRREETRRLLRTLRRTDMAVRLADLEPILRMLQLDALFSARPPRTAAALDPGFMICRGVAGVNVPVPFGGGLTQPDSVQHAWRGGPIALGSHDCVRQQDGFKPGCTIDGHVASFPRLYMQIQCPSWSHREKRTSKNAGPGHAHVRHSVSGPVGSAGDFVGESAVSSSLMSMHEATLAVPPPPTLKSMQSQDDWEIGRKARSGSSMPNIFSDNEKIDHKVICAVVSGHIRHGIRIGQRDRTSIYEIEDLTGQSESASIGGSPTEVDFQLQLYAEAPNICGISRCALAVLPANAPAHCEPQHKLMELGFDASAEEHLFFHISSSHFDSNSSYSVDLNWVLCPRLLLEAPQSRREGGT